MSEAKRKPNVSMEKFLEVYKAATSNAEVAETLGITVQQVMARRKSYSDKLVEAGFKPLAKFERAAGGNRIDVALLAKLAGVEKAETETVSA